MTREEALRRVRVIWSQFSKGYFGDVECQEQIVEALLPVEAQAEGLRLREALRDEIVRLMYAGHGHPDQDRRRFCSFEGEGPCPDCSAVDAMDTALASRPAPKEESR